MADCPECGKKIGVVFGGYTIYLEENPYEFCTPQCAKRYALIHDPNLIDQKVAAIEASVLEREKRTSIDRMIFVSDAVISGSEIKRSLGMARGATVRSKHAGSDIAAGLKSIVGGELKGYTALLAEGREEAIYRMKTDAHEMGANAIVMTRFTTSMIADGAVEVMAYGTAVIVEGQETE